MVVAISTNVDERSVSERAPEMAIRTVNMRLRAARHTSSETLWLKGANGDHSALRTWRWHYTRST